MPIVGQSAEEWKYDTGIVIYQSDYYGGADSDVAGTEKFSDDIDLTEKTGAGVDVKFLASGSTDDLHLKIYQRGDADWDGSEIQWKGTMTISNDGTEKTYHHNIPRGYGAGHYRYGLVRSGSTDSFDVQIKVYKSRIFTVRKES